MRRGFRSLPIDCLIVGLVAVLGVTGRVAGLEGAGFVAVRGVRGLVFGGGLATFSFSKVKVSSLLSCNRMTLVNWNNE